MSNAAAFHPSDTASRRTGAFQRHDAPFLRRPDAAAFARSTPANAADPVADTAPEPREARPARADTPPPAPPAAVKAEPDPALLEAARQEGIALGRAAAEEALNPLKSALEAALAALADTSALSDTLGPAMDAAILRLASERAGIAIDAHPEAFAERLSGLIARLSDGARQARLELNPEDLAALEQAVPADTLGVATLAPSADLRRGDARLVAPQVTLSDLLGAPA